MEKYIIGIDLGGTTTKFAVVTPDGEIIRQWAIDTDCSNKGQSIVPNIISEIKMILSEMDLKKEDILGIGMGSPGNVDRHQGTVTGAYNLNWASPQPIRKQVTFSLGMDIYIDNDANVAALGEQWRGAGNQEANIIFVTLGTGVGGGIILNNELIHGASDGAGEIGHITIEEEGYPCTCGKRGCLETVASATGLARLACDRINQFEGESTLAKMIQNPDKRDNVDAKIIFDQAKENDPYALDIVELYTDYLAFSLANVASLLNPSTIVLGGGVSHAGEFLAKKVDKKLQQNVFPTLRGKTKIKIAELGNDAGVLGAASLVINEKLNDE